MGRAGDRELGLRERIAITVSGTVQGVGFRPFVHALAVRHGLHGFVRNRTGDVFIEAEGEPIALERFVEELTRRPPPHARIERIRSTSCEATPASLERDFRIDPSEADASAGVALPPDLATCDACVRELFDPNDRRYRYPFLNCTHCGPRLTIVTGAPYDRERTVMAAFPLCDACRAESEDPSDRRFHAQPIACPACGPRLSFLDAEGAAVSGTEPVAAAVAAIRRGAIVAIKGLGGYHLACDAAREDAVTRLRERKHRDEKPFALMVADVAAAAALCALGPAERALLESPARPIVLLDRSDAGDGPAIAPAVAPGMTTLGLMLPYTPLHHLLLRDLSEGGATGVLVMTSGNRSDEPIAYLDPEALAQLRGIAEFFLTHDRPIETRCDDSIVRGADPLAPGPVATIPLRRSRGYAPLPVGLGEPGVAIDRPTLAAGGDLKSTFALAAGARAVVSHHLGDLGHYSAMSAYEAAVAHYERLHRIAPLRIVHDLHPDYASTRYALERARRTGVELLAVQHHHAHMASCMAEHGLAGPAIGVCFDGAGLGLDGTMWGGEFFLGGYRAVSRVAHLRAVRMPGGDAASREPWRMAVAHLALAELDVVESEVARRVGGAHVSTALAMVARAFNAPLTSSVGRLFDAIASLAGVCDRASFEAQGAMRLEALASRAAPGPGYDFGIEGDGAELDPAPVVRAVVADVRRGVEAATIARRFHTGLADAVLRTCSGIRDRGGVADVVLSGGVFSNALLSGEVAGRLGRAGFRVHRHRTVPPNDGGLSLGQMAIAAAVGERDERDRRGVGVEVTTCA
jgi:hydrogenase maturation protein HypF